jgi:hypothetical protein
MGQAVGRRPLTSRDWIQFQASKSEIVVDKVALAQGLC